MVNNSRTNPSSDTISYLELLQEILNKKNNLLGFAGVGLVLGLLIVFTTPKEYQSSSFILLEPEGNVNSFGQMGTLAGLAGINISQLPTSQMALTSDIFPDVIHSRDFLIEISKEEFKFESKSGQIQTLGDYYFKERPGNIVKKTINYIISVPGIVSGWFAKPDPLPSILAKSDEDQSDYLKLTSQELIAIGELKKRILLEQKGKLVHLNVEMPEPLIAAKVNTMVLERLIDYVTAYKVGRQQRNVEFIEQRVKETEQKFNEAQMRLASFRDSNQGLISQSARTREEQLQFEFNIAYNLYNSLKQELEQATIQMKKETPVFTVLEKAAVPLGPSKPNKPLLLIFSIFLGVFSGVLFNLYRILVKKINPVF